MLFLKKQLVTLSRSYNTWERLRQMYITQPQTPKLTHKHLTDKEIEGAVSIFNHFDKNKDKKWTVDEFEEYVKWHTNYGLSQAKIKDVFTSVDKNGNKRVTVDEFLDYRSRKSFRLPSERTLEDMFSKCDKDEDGLISLEELRHILLLLGEDLSRLDNIRQTFAHHDKDKDGFINVYEFMQLINTATERSRSTTAE